MFQVPTTLCGFQGICFSNFPMQMQQMLADYFLGHEGKSETF